MNAESTNRSKKSLLFFQIVTLVLLAVIGWLWFVSNHSLKNGLGQEYIRQSLLTPEDVSSASASDVIIQQHI